MTKKYRLKIPDMIRREDAWCADALRHVNGEVFHERQGAAHPCGTGTIWMKDIPSDWLEEIIEEPVSAEELADSIFKEYFNLPRTQSKILDLTYPELLAIVQKVEANQKLRNRLKQSFGDALRKFEVWWANAPQIQEYVSKSHGFEIWEACEKSHNWEKK